MSTKDLAKGYPLPIPVLSVRFWRLAETIASAPQIEIVDTGADMTIAPADILTDLQAQELQEANLISQWGDEHPSFCTLLTLKLTTTSYLACWWPVTKLPLKSS